MKDKIASGMTLAFLSLGILSLNFNIQPTNVYEPIYIRADGSVDPRNTSISTVDNITYAFTDSLYNSIVVEKDNIVVDGRGYTLEGNSAIEPQGIYLLERNNITIKNLQFNAFYYGVLLNCSSDINISKNNLTNHMYGIYVCESTDIGIYENNIVNNWFGIRLKHSLNNKITENNITNNRDGIVFTSSSNNTISENRISNQTNRGIELWGSSGNTVCGNNITNNHVGTKLYWSSNNRFYHNNFLDNFLQVIVERSSFGNFWDDGYLFGGNSWSDYTGVDADGDGIGDAPYVIDGNNKDNYPFCGIPPLPFWIQWWFWTAITTGIATFATFVYFLRRRVSVGIVTVSWIVLMVLLFFYPFLAARLGQEVSFSLWSAYMLVASVSLTTFFERESVIRRFGLQRNNALGLLVVTCLVFLATYYFDLNDLLGLNALEVIFFAPLLEEIFYRGYMLGTLCKHDYDGWKWKPRDLGWIAFTSLLFALGHIYTQPRALMLNIFISSLPLGFLYIRTRTILWSFLVHMLYNLTMSFGLIHLYFPVLIVFSAIILLVYFLESTGLSKLIRTSPEERARLKAEVYRHRLQRLHNFY